MKYKTIGDSDNPIVNIHLDKNEQVKIERGSMVYLQDVEIQGQTNSKSKGIGGFLSATGRSLVSGESVFITYATGKRDESLIGIAPSIPGKITCLKIGGDKQYRLNTGAFLACDASVNYVMKSQNIGKAVFAGTGGLFVMETEGEGDMLINAFGDLMELEVTPDSPITIDNTHVVAWDATLDYKLRIASGTIGFTTGEGIVNEFHGSGKILIQTRNIRDLAQSLNQYLIS
jgi:uncharacterized protein (TIGR00266 family)